MLNSLVKAKAGCALEVWSSRAPNEERMDERVNTGLGLCTRFFKDELEGFWQAAADAFQASFRGDPRPGA